MHLCYQTQSAIESLAPRAAFSRTPRCNEGVDEDPDVKVIVLGNSHRGGAASSFSFEVLR